MDPGYIAQKSRPIFKDDFLRNMIVSIYFLVFSLKTLCFEFLIRVIICIKYSVLKFSVLKFSE